jgi:hypothetical protein
MIGVEQLVDGMDIDGEWCSRHLSSEPLTVQDLAAKLVRRKPARLDAFNGNQVTCFIATPEEAKEVHKIAGYD